MLSEGRLCYARRKLGQQLAWQLKQGAVRQEVMQLLGGLLQALQQRNQQGVTHYVSALVKSHFDECPWIPALKRLIKLYGLQ